MAESTDDPAEEPLEPLEWQAAPADALTTPARAARTSLAPAPGKATESVLGSLRHRAGGKRSSCCQRGRARRSKRQPRSE